MKTNYQNQPRCLRKSTLITLVAFILLGTSQNVLAQWTTAPNGNDIYKTNSIGNVGIGTSAPTQSLHIRNDQNTNTMVLVENLSNVSGAQANFRAVNDNNGISQVGIYGSASSYGSLGGDESYLYSNRNLVLMAEKNTGVIKFTTGGRFEKMRIDASGNVGIGTTSPNASAKLHVRSGDTPGILLLDSGSSTGQFSDIWLADRGSVKWELLKSPDNSAFAIYDSAAATYRAYFKNNGNVGIGTTNPQSLLDVNGSINSSSNINATGTITGGNIVIRYQDVAEWVPSSEKLSTGTVVVLDATKSNQVIASTVSYDTRVAGVVSEQPGIALGERGAGKVLVATTGRVKVKVDATRAPIQVGDLLVTSDTPGVAMRSQPVNLGGVQIHRPGTLIGKALEPLVKGSGEILVLLSLQ